MMQGQTRSAGQASSSVRSASLKELIHLSKSRRLSVAACTHSLWRAAGGLSTSRFSPWTSGRCPEGQARRSLTTVKARFTKLVELRALYRDFIRAKALLRLQTPIYTPLEEAPAPDPNAEGDAGVKERELEEQERRREAVEIVAEMQLTAEQLKSGLRTLPTGFGDIFPAGSSSPDQYESQIRDQAWQYIVDLRERVAVEIAQLPFPNLAAAQAALDTRNARYTRTYSQAEGLSSPLPSSGSSSGSSSGTSTPVGGGSSGGILLPGGDAAQQLASSIEKLGQAEKVAEQFVATRIKPVLRKAREGELVDMVKETGVYLKGLWVRLNGGGSRVREPALSPDLPLPTRAQMDTELAVSQLSLELDGIESRLRDAARAREAKLRKVRAPEGRATMPFQLKMMDEEVLRLSRELAVRMLQVEMEYAYSSLEDEAMDLASSDVEDLLRRQGSTTELRLLAVEFQYLDEQLAELAAQINPTTSTTSTTHASTTSTASSNTTSTSAATITTTAALRSRDGSSGAMDSAGMGSALRSRDGGSGAASGAAGAGGGAGAGVGMGNVVRVGGVPVSVEELLEALANEVPDMRQRVGVPDQVVFGGQGFSLTKARLQLNEALDKLRDAITFMTRGLKLLSSDISSAARLFGRAAIGGTLKPREVSALRRTARDLLTFIPFTIILIIPLSPLGHVLVFGFIQQYFPSFFPSCFTGKRQEMMVRYEELERQLLAARSQAEQVEEEAELVKAAAAVVTQGSVIVATAGMTGRQNTNGSASGRGDPGRQEAGAKSGSGGGGAAALRSRDGGNSGGSGGAGGAVATAAGDVWHSFTTLDEAASVAVAAQTAQVRALEERIAAVLDDVTLGDEPVVEGTSSGAAPKGKRRAA